ncbi:type II toxin-antitoxin system Phd/YefM family antitoxin [Glycomyces salinus]|uniref:type II toxin-antitoxin system Phd/YefM family antitoxin n=1 Tax=Glycomyces salinus TaxID=980294 RepID=UPI0018EA602F|nr:type II toxin-antitoxin system prevent-host-death family antitoxin [Glycomyces salinus]
MDQRITQRELRNESGRILRATEHGEEFIVTRNGTPVARLTPVADESPFVSAETMRDSAAGLPEVDFGRLRRELGESVEGEFLDPYERNA